MSTEFPPAPDPTPVPPVPKPPPELTPQQLAHRRWVVRLGIVLAALLLTASLFVDRINSNSQLEYLRHQLNAQDATSACRSQIAVDLDVATVDYRLASGHVDQLITDAIAALIARDDAGLAAAGEAIKTANVVANTAAAALTTASARRADTAHICPSTAGTG